jgi:hypothetical protein
VQEWEYTWVYIPIISGKGSLPEQLNMKFEAGKRHWDVVEKHGREGWELTSVTADTASSGTKGLLFTFKRQLEESPESN